MCGKFQEILRVGAAWDGKTCLAGTGTLNPSPQENFRANILLLNSFACFLVRVVLDLHSEKMLGQMCLTETCDIIDLSDDTPFSHVCFLLVLKITMTHFFEQK